MTTRKATKKKAKKFRSAVERAAAEELRSLLRTAKLQRRIKRLTAAVDRASSKLRRDLLDYASLWAREHGYVLTPKQVVE